MKKLIAIFSLGVLAVLFLAHLGYAQDGAPGAPVGRMFDPKTITTVSGEVVSVDKIPAPRPGMQGRVTFNLKTDKETLLVYLGPDFYLEQQGARFAPGDKVQLKGSLVTVDGKPTLIPIEVKKGDQTFKLRDERGVPLWSGAVQGRQKGKGKQQ
ncbi:MAG: DNA-binding protein [Deltaproteobacteria bacterium]|nr:DNA-binding protein [Deltaproteobacteria bacterium]